jgi:hypothetical protein
MRKANTLRDLLDGNYVDDFARVSVPDLSAGNGDSDDYFLGFTGHGLIELPNRDLLMTMYGEFKGDKMPIPYYKQPSHQNRAWVCISRGRGKSWNYLSTIASVDAHPLPRLAEGYCEADLLRIEGQRLLSVMRTGGNPTPTGGTDRFTPLYAALSNDGGLTWQSPTPIYKYGVWPGLLKMKDGTIVCEGGRPGVFLLFSTDNARTGRNLS